MTIYRQATDQYHKVFFKASICIGLLAFFLMSVAVSASSAEENFLESEGEIFTVVNGMVGAQCTGKIVAITDTQIEIKNKEAKRRAYVIGKATKMCDKRNQPISAKDFTEGELVTISTTNDDKGNAVGIRKGPILIRLTDMQPVPIGK